jgi:hypothetical protein
MCQDVGDCSRQRNPVDQCGRDARLMRQSWADVPAFVISLCDAVKLIDSFWRSRSEGGESTRS